MRLAKYEQKMTLFGGEAKISLVSPAPQAQVEQFYRLLWLTLIQFEQRFSRFLPKSELTYLNQNAGDWVAISHDMAEVLQETMRLSVETDGLFNPFVLPGVQRAGYLQSAIKAYADDSVPSYVSRSVVPIDSLEIRRTTARIPKNSALDLGGIGKGYIAEKLRLQLHELPLIGYVIWLSGDIATWGHDENGQTWRVGIQDATVQGGEVPYTVLCPAKPFAIATSGTLRRQGQESNKGHHIIDPTTSRSVETDIKLLTVADSSLTKADVMASCGVIKGSEQCGAFMDAQSISTYLLQTSRRTIARGSYLLADTEKQVAHTL